ncbi:unnamed protein product [Arabidopsis halleri]
MLLPLFFIFFFSWILLFSFVGSIKDTIQQTTSGSPTASSSHTNDGGLNKRKIISNKIRSLEKLMPWERKMSLAMILKESNLITGRDGVDGICSHFFNLIECGLDCFKK